MKLGLSLLLALMLAGCGGGGGGSDDNGGSNSTEIVGPMGIIDNMRVSNLDSTVFPWQGINPDDRPANGRAKAWDYLSDGLIPVKTNGSADAVAAMDRIEQMLGLVIFDRLSIENTPNDMITRGLIVSVGTALGAEGVINENTCGHVSREVGSTNYPANFVSDEGKIDTVLYVHISSAGCAASLDVVIHEFGHALGLGSHFEGFGIGPPIDGNFWNVLYNIYINQVGTAEADLTIAQLVFE